MDLNWHNEFLETQKNIPSGQSRILDSVFPMAGDYFSPLNPIFLEKLSDASFLSKEKVWLSRDGILTALWFLLRNKPDDVKGKIYFHESLAPFIPDEWRTKAGLYLIESHVSDKPKALLLTGILSAMNMDAEEFRLEVENLRKLLKQKRMKNLPVYAYLPFRSSFPGLDDKLPGMAMKELLSLFQGEVEFIDFRFLKYRSLKNFSYHELNSGWLYRDSYLQQLALSKGASLLDSPVSAPKMTKIALSPFHSVSIFPMPKGKALLPGTRELKKSIILNSFSTSTNAGEWPEGFVRLMKKHVKSLS